MTPFTLLLFAVAAITAAVELLSDSGDPTWWLTPLIIIVMVMISGLVSFVENGRSERSSDALRRYTENTSTVIREGKPVEVGKGKSSMATSFVSGPGTCFRPILISDRLNGKRILICKGFPGTLKDRIGFVKDNDAVRPATKDDIVRIKETADRHASSPSLPSIWP